MNTIQIRLANTAKKYPGHCALSCDGETKTYRELEVLSDQIAIALYDAGVVPGTIIAVLCNDRLRLIESMLGIWKAGCVFMPMDTQYPDSYLSDMLGDSIVHSISDHSNRACLERLMFKKSNKLILNIEEILAGTTNRSGPPEVQYGADDMIYLYFTSGTTGKPKGVMGRNQGLLHFIEWEIETLKLEDTVRVSQFTPPCHDPFFRDVLVALCTGGTVCIPKDKGILLAESSLIDWLEKEEVTVVHCTPTLFNVFASGGLTAQTFPKLEHVLLAGEKVIPARLRNWYGAIGNRIALYNLYGPTETTLAKMYYPIQPEDAYRHTIPIGSPISAAKVILLDENNRVCGLDEVGEIYIRTKYRSLGYYQNEPETKKRFIQNPFSNSPDDLIYKTGDLGRLLPDRSIAFVGRADRQVKNFGFRIELDAVESVISEYFDIIECAVKQFSVGIEDTLSGEVEFCARCGLPTTYTKTALNAQNLCDICVAYPAIQEKAQAYFQQMEDLEALFQKRRIISKSKYDCMLLFSGGKDSTYALYKLVGMGMNVLAYTFDNGYISDVALENIRLITAELEVDLIIDQYDRMNQVFAECLKEEHGVCNGCFKVLRTQSTRLAYDKGIGVIVTGFSRGQIMELRLSNLLIQDSLNMQDIEQRIIEQRKMYFRKPDAAGRIMQANQNVTDEMLEEIQLVDFYRYTSVTRAEILGYLQKKSVLWHDPEDTGACSSNCLVNDVGIYTLKRALGYDNYTVPNSWEVRLGHITRDEAIKQYSSDVDLEKVRRIMNEIGYEADLITQNDHNDYICGYYVSNRDINAEELRKYLMQKLPYYAIPHYLVKLDSMPRTQNGKVDYKRLPEPYLQQTEEEFEPPLNEVERMLATIWCDILKAKQVGRRDSFLLKGGSSLNVMSMISEVYRACGVELPLEIIFENATLAKLADYINEHSNNNLTSAAIKTMEEPVHRLSHVVETQSIIMNIKPFNDIFYKSCFYNAFFPVVVGNNRSILPYLLNDCITYHFDDQESEDAVRFSVNYTGIKNPEELLDENGIDVIRHRPKEYVADAAVSSILEGRPVIVSVDCYYEPLRKDMYEKNHWPHSLLVYGFDYTKQIFFVMEHMQVDSLTYKACELSFKDLTKAHLMYLSNYDETLYYPSYLELGVRDENKDSGTYAQEARHFFEQTVLPDMLARHEHLNYLPLIRENISYLISSKSVLDRHINSLLLTLNNIVNAKTASLYMFEHLMGNDGDFHNLASSIMTHWKDIRNIIQKYKLSSRWKKDSLASIPGLVNSIEKDEWMLYNQFSTI